MKMNFSNKPKDSNPSSPHFNLFTSIRTHCLDFFHHMSNALTQQNLLNPNPNHLKTHLQLTISNLGIHAKHAIDTGISRLLVSPFPPKTLVKPQISEFDGNIESKVFAMSIAAIEERLSGIPVYALSNSFEQCVFISNQNGKSLGLFCFRQEDAETLLEKMKSVDPTMGDQSKVIPVALNKVFQLKVDGVAFRLIPEVSQIKNALMEKEKDSILDNGFPGVPVFQSRSLVLRSGKKTYRPIFFRKEDLEKSLDKASSQETNLNRVLTRSNVQVDVLEEIIEAMKDGTTSNWDDVVFVPPGFDISKR